MEEIEKNCIECKSFKVRLYNYASDIYVIVLNAKLLIRC